MGSRTTGQVAREAGVNVETIRFYERKGLLQEPPRLASGYRQYGPEAVRRVLFIKRAQDLGFTLKEIAELLALRVEHDTQCADFCELADGKIAAIREKIRTLDRMRTVLADLTSACRERKLSGPCPILESLDPADDKESP